MNSGEQAPTNMVKPNLFNEVSSNSHFANTVTLQSAEFALRHKQGSLKQSPVEYLWTLANDEAAISTVCTAANTRHGQSQRPVPIPEVTPDAVKEIVLEEVGLTARMLLLQPEQLQEIIGLDRKNFADEHTLRHHVEEMYLQNLPDMQENKHILIQARQQLDRLRQQRLSKARMMFD